MDHTSAPQTGNEAAKSSPPETDAATRNLLVPVDDAQAGIACFLQWAMLDLVSTHMQSLEFSSCHAAHQF